MKSAVAPNIFATEDVSIGTGDRNARRVQSLQVLIKIIRSYSAEILRIYRGASSVRDQVDSSWQDRIFSAICVQDCEPAGAGACKFAGSRRNHR